MTESDQDRKQKIISGVMLRFENILDTSPDALAQRLNDLERRVRELENRLS